MSIFKIIGPAAVLSTILATPVPAQPVIYEPGYCAFFYPNANCQNAGPGNPYTDPNHQRRMAQDGRAGGETVGMSGKKPRTQRSVPPATRMQ
ncbi:hypothetical protein [Bradyrhizobium sp.]|uniref:hypothetical protein n=1 Tax=Bradyrhizobium sp. TaxID=376 RepID=UPI0027362526|nr:hypothetical protein [Bradyrhizobium sp.]MDP3693332.1 hypothetical protein [Bradyrhizobium sp.]